MSGKSAFREWLFNLHLWLGMIAGLFIIVLGLTGAIMAFEPEIERATHPKLFYVTPQGRAMTLAETAALVARAYPGDTIGGYLVPTRPDLSYQVGTSKRAVFVNQYTGQVLGTASGGATWLNYVHQMHLRLLITANGDPGKKIVTGAGTIMTLMLLSGLYLWWPLKRFSVSWRGTGARRSWFDLHNAVGIFSFVFLLLLSATGLAIGYEGTATSLFYKVSGSLPSSRPRVKLTPPTGAVPISLDSAFAMARAALPGATPFQILVPRPGDPIQIRSHYPEDRTPGGRSIVIIDPYTPRVLFAEGSRGAPAGARMVIANRALHTGDIAGIPSKALMSLASVMAVVQVWSGVVMWWKRKERNAA